MQQQANDINRMMLLSAEELCDAARMSDVRRSFSESNFFQTLESALKTAQAENTLESEIAVQKARDKVLEAIALADGAELADVIRSWTEQLTTALRGIPASDDLRLTLDFYRARALATEHDDEEALHLLHAILADENFNQPSVDLGLRQDVLTAVMEVEATLGHPWEALLAQEQWCAEVAHTRRLAQDLDSTRKDSAEAAMERRSRLLDRQAAAARTGVAAFSDLSWSYRLPNRTELEKALNYLPNSTTTLIYHPLRNRLLIWRYERDAGLRVYVRPFRTMETAFSIRRLTRSLANNQPDWSTESKALYDTLISPVGPLAPNRTIAIIGNSQLGGLSFESLGKTANTTLLSTNPVIYLNQLVESADVQSRTLRKDEVFIGIDSPLLSGPETEAKALAEQSSKEAMLGSDATVARVRSAIRSARFAYIATHGVLEERNPFRSHLVLADRNLEAWQLFQDGAGAELLVFSACDMRRAPESSMSVGGAQESTFTAIAFDGGARRIVSSLWAANDKSAIRIVEAFHRELMLQPRDVAGALQRAKLSERARSTGAPGLYMNFVIAARSPGFVQLSR